MNANGESYYRKDLNRLYDQLVPRGVRTLRTEGAYIRPGGVFEYIIVDNYIGFAQDIQVYLKSLLKHLSPEGKVVISYYNHLWEPIIELVTRLGWRKEERIHSWVNSDDLANLLNLAGYEVITTQRRLLLPVELGPISDFVNKWVAILPVINNLCLTTYTVARPKILKGREYSVSIVVPARNEEKNILKLIPLLPTFGKSLEIIFVEGHSKDGTWKAIEKVAKKYKGNKKIKIKAFRQSGIGKADAVRLGFEKASGEMLMILDADLTVDPSELPKFYEVIASGLGEFVNGCRLIYPMERQAMRTLNILGNQVFSWLFTWILGQNFKDTLCGTKVLLKRDYQKIVDNRKFFGDFDPFGDFDLIFGAVKQNMKIIELPIRYKERTYGSTNISRFTHGLLLLRMTWFALLKFKAW